MANAYLRTNFRWTAASAGGIDELAQRVARTSIILLDPRPQPMMLRGFTIRRDGTGADVEQVRLKIGAVLLMALWLQKSAGTTFTIDMTIPANETLTLESDAPVYVDSVRLTEVTVSNLDLQHRWASGNATFGSAIFAQQGPMPIAYGFVSSEPMLQPPKNIPKPTPLPVDKDGKIKSFIETLGDNKK